jgi:hypothetical protein
MIRFDTIVFDYDTKNMVVFIGGGIITRLSGFGINLRQQARLNEPEYQWLSAKVKYDDHKGKTQRLLQGWHNHSIER